VHYGKKGVPKSESFKFPSRLNSADKNYIGMYLNIFCNSKIGQ
jgi:hypothetical protein